MDAPTTELVSVGNTYNWKGIDTIGLTKYLVLDKDSQTLETSTEPSR